MKKKQSRDEYHVHGEELLKKIKELIAEGNVRKITITNKDGKTLVVFPLTFGVIGAVIAPVLAAVGAMAALITECTISVERKE
jgi:diacylglycerol kinase family enzyme